MLTRPPPSTPISATSPLVRGVRAASSFGTMPPSNVPSPTSDSARSGADRVGRARRRGTRPGTSVRKRIRSAPSPTASADAASSAFTLSGPRASGETPGRDRPRARRRSRRARDGTGSPTSPSSGICSASSPTSSPASAHRVAARSPRRRAALTAARLSRTTSSPSAVVTRRPSTNSHLEPAPRHLLGDLRAGAVHDADRVARGAQRRDGLGDAAGRRAADLEDDDAHVR